MVRIRLSRMGRTHRPFYRINAIEKRNQRDGKILENLGWYNPIEKDPDKQVSLNEERIKHWISAGAQPSDTCADLFAKAGVIDAAKRQAELDKRYGRRIEKMKVELEAKRVAEAAAAKAEAEAAAAKAKAEEEAAAAAAAPEADKAE